MKLLILTQKVDINDDILGFFHNWIIEFAKYYEKVTVICLQKAEYKLPENVVILSLGKEGGGSRLKYLYRFYKYISRERKNYDKVFVHMNPEYAVLGGWLWKLWGKKISLWYTHKSVNLKLKIAEKFCDIIFTASRESFGLKSEKVKVVGHGIDINRLKIRDSKLKINGKFNIIYVGRISRIKNQKLLIQAIDILVNQNNFRNLEINLVGGSVYKKDNEYLNSLRDLVKKNNLQKLLNFVGTVPFKDIGQYYQQADLAINLCSTGGMDKAVLEAIAAGLPVIVLNKTFATILGEYKKEMILASDSAVGLAKKIRQASVLPEEKKEKIKNDFFNLAAAHFSLAGLIKKIYLTLKV